MGIQASPELLREMSDEFRHCSKKLKGIADTARATQAKTAVTWSDAKGQEFQAIMRRIAALTESPSEPLDRAAPKLDHLAELLIRYHNTRLG